MPPARPQPGWCKQSLPDAPDRSRAQHRGDARHHNLDTHTRAIRNLLERFAEQILRSCLQKRENFRVDRIVVLNRQHPISPPRGHACPTPRAAFQIAQINTAAK
jgi:hypothetical protein